MILKQPLWGHDADTVLTILLLCMLALGALIYTVLPWVIREMVAQKMDEEAITLLKLQAHYKAMVTARSTTLKESRKEEFYKFLQACDDKKISSLKIWAFTSPF